MEYSDSPTPASDSSGISQKTWEWMATPGLNDPPPYYENISCSYSLVPHPTASASPETYRAYAHVRFEISGNARAAGTYYKNVSGGTESGNTPPAGETVTQWTQYADCSPVQASPGPNGLPRIRAQASASLYSEAFVYDARVGFGQASSGQASIQITDFDCPDQHR